MQLTFKAALLAEGFKNHVTFEVDDGIIQSIRTDDASNAAIDAVAVPGLANVHSHAFQRAMAGRAEVKGGVNSFWGWRARMYELVERLSVEEVAAISAFTYAEMLQSGYTAVGEFHYFHKPDQAERALDTAEAMREAARQTGLRQCLLPTLYQRGGFDGRPLTEAQRKFHLTESEFRQVVHALDASASPRLTTGMAFHSLRAVDIDTLSALATQAGQRPIHIHISEQRLEVEECVATHQKTPIDYLMDTGLVDRRWCLVHATHATPAEIERLAAAQVVVGYCVTTEANLGDGYFDFRRFARLGGRFAVGSDSQVSIDPAEELRWIEYQCRLIEQRRPSTLWEEGTHAGVALYQKAYQGGAQALGHASLAVGAPFDVVALSHPALAHLEAAQVVDAWVFAPRAGLVQQVWVHGQQVVQNARHVHYDALARRYQQALENVLGKHA